MKLHNPNFPGLLCFTFLHIIMLFTVTILCLKPATSSATPTNETDRWALLKFKESIDYDPYGILSSWNDSIHFCNWHGITCSRRHQRVTTLELQGHNLRGTILPYIGNLTFLRAINLQNNSFYGEIPKEVGQLFRLRELNLTNNTLGGEIPTILSNCSELRLIRVTNNKLIGKIPMKLGSLTKLNTLWVAKNNFIGGIPGFLGNLSLLVIFSASYNDLEGNIPESVGRLKSLSYFVVGVNKLNGMVPSSLYNISSLTALAFYQNQLSGTLPENIAHTLPNLKGFLFNDNKFFGSIPSSLCNASKLQKIDLSINNFVGLVPTNLGCLQDLEFLHLSENKLGRDLDFLKSLSNCSKMNVLAFTNNQFEAVLPSSIGNLSTQLTRLYLGGNEISGTIPIVLQNLINLILLGMDENLFTGMIPTCFGKFQKMQGLYLLGNKLSGKIPSSIGNLTQLVVLFLSQNNLEGSIPPSIDTCQSLFKDGLNLHNFVKMSLPKRLIQVVNPMLLPREVEEMGVATAAMMATKEDDNDNEIVEEANNTEDFRHIDVDMQKCLLLILNIGILCSLESPKERVNMEEIIKELRLIRSTFIGLRIRRGRPSRAQERGTSF